MEKAKIRKAVLQKRRKMKKKDVNDRSKKIIAKLKKTKEFKDAKTIMFYVSSDNEVFTHDIIKECFEKKTVVVPFVANEEILISTISSFDDLSAGAYDILEPKKIRHIFREKLDLVLVPGIAFDKKGNRVGYGLGYYDIFLKGLDCKKVGLAFKLQIVKQIPSQQHDVKMDSVITE